MQRLSGERPLPWEGDLRHDVSTRLGLFKGPVLRLLHRDAGCRPSMREFHATCTQIFAARPGTPDPERCRRCSHDSTRSSAGCRPDDE